MDEKKYSEIANSIYDCLTDEQKAKEDDAIYNLQGIRLKKKPTNGEVYIQGGRKCVGH